MKQLKSEILLKKGKFGYEAWQTNKLLAKVPGFDEESKEQLMKMIPKYEDIIESSYDKFYEGIKELHRLGYTIPAVWNYLENTTDHGLEEQFGLDIETMNKLGGGKGIKKEIEMIYKELDEKDLVTNSRQIKSSLSADSLKDKLEGTFWTRAEDFEDEVNDAGWEVEDVNDEYATISNDNGSQYEVRFYDHGEGRTFTMESFKCIYQDEDDDDELTSSRQINSEYEEQKFSQGHDDASEGREPVMPNDKDYMAGYNYGKDDKRDDYTPGSIDITASRKLTSRFNQNGGGKWWYTLSEVAQYLSALFFDLRTIHFLTTGSEFYTYHELAQELYEQTEDYYDDIVETAIGYDSDIQPMYVLPGDWIFVNENDSLSTDDNITQNLILEKLQKVYDILENVQGYDSMVSSKLDGMKEFYDKEIYKLRQAIGR